MAKTPAAAIKLLTDIGAPAIEKARSEARRMQTLIDARARRLRRSSRGTGSTTPSGCARPSTTSTSRRSSRTSSSIACCTTACSSPRRSSSASRSRSATTFRSIIRTSASSRCSTPTARRSRCSTPTIFKRDNKSGGAWMDSFVDQSGLLGTKPVVFNVANFTKPAPGQPALLSFDDVTTLFHEFGHALHGMFSRVEYPMLTGTNVPRDFVEFPSQFNEHWALEPTRVRALREAPSRPASRCPHALVDEDQDGAHVQSGLRAHRIHRRGADRHGVAHAARRARRSATSTRSSRRRSRSITSTCARCRRATARSYFAHIWDGGYQAGYFAYLWAEVLDHDAYAWFTRARRPDARERPAVSRHDSVARRHARRRRRCTASSAAAIRASSRCSSSAASQPETGGTMNRSEIVNRRDTIAMAWSSCSSPASRVAVSTSRAIPSGARSTTRRAAARRASSFDSPTA